MLLALLCLYLHISFHKRASEVGIAVLVLQMGKQAHRDLITHAASLSASEGAGIHFVPAKSVVFQPDFLGAGNLHVRSLNLARLLGHHFFQKKESALSIVRNTSSSLRPREIVMLLGTFAVNILPQTFHTLLTGHKAILP